MLHRDDLLTDNRHIVAVGGRPGTDNFSGRTGIDVFRPLIGNIQLAIVYKCSRSIQAVEHGVVARFQGCGQISQILITTDGEAFRAIGQQRQGVVIEHLHLYHTDTIAVIAGAVISSKHHSHRAGGGITATDLYLRAEIILQAITVAVHAAHFKVIQAAVVLRQAVKLHGGDLIGSAIGQNPQEVGRAVCDRSHIVHNLRDGRQLREVSAGIFDFVSDLISPQFQAGRRDQSSEQAIDAIEVFGFAQRRKNADVVLVAIFDLRRRQIALRQAGRGVGGKNVGRNFKGI